MKKQDKIKSGKKRVKRKQDNKKPQKVHEEEEDAKEGEMEQLEPC